jgi:hypothetical protein
MSALDALGILLCLIFLAVTVTSVIITRRLYRETKEIWEQVAAKRAERASEVLKNAGDLVAPGKKDASDTASAPASRQEVPEGCDALKCRVDPTTNIFESFATATKIVGGIPGGREAIFEFVKSAENFLKYLDDGAICLDERLQGGRQKPFGPSGVFSLSPEPVNVVDNPIEVLLRHLHDSSSSVGAAPPKRDSGFGHSDPTEEDPTTHSKPRSA